MMFLLMSCIIHYLQETSSNIPQNDGPVPLSSSKGRKHSTHNRHDTGSGPQSTRSRNITQLDGPRGDSSSDESDESSESEVEEEAEGVRKGGRGKAMLYRAIHAVICNILKSF